MTRSGQTFSSTLLLLALVAAFQLAFSFRSYAAVYASPSQVTSSSSLRMSSNEGFSKDSTFASQKDYLLYLQSISTLPDGFSVGNTRFNFRPFEMDKTLPMNLTLILTDKVGR